MNPTQLLDQKVTVYLGAAFVGFALVDPYARWGRPSAALPLRVFDLRGSVLAVNRNGQWVHPTTHQPMRLEPGW